MTTSKSSRLDNQQSLAETLFHLPLLTRSRTQEAAMNLYAMDFNVFPVPFGKKAGYPWRALQFTRLNPDDIYPLFSGECNIAVMTGRTSGNLFVIDCETHSAFKWHERMFVEFNISIFASKTYVTAWRRLRRWEEDGTWEELWKDF